MCIDDAPGCQPIAADCKNHARPGFNTDRSVCKSDAHASGTRHHITLGVIDIGRRQPKFIRLRAPAVGAYLGCCALLHTESADHWLRHSLPEAANLEVLE